MVLLRVLWKQGTSCGREAVTAARLLAIVRRRRWISAVKHWLGLQGVTGKGEGFLRTGRTAGFFCTAWIQEALFSRKLWSSGRAGPARDRDGCGSRKGTGREKGTSNRPALLAMEEDTAQVDFQDAIECRRRAELHRVGRRTPGMRVCERTQTTSFYRLQLEGPSPEHHLLRRLKHPRNCAVSFTVSNWTPRSRVVSRSRRSS